MTQFDDSDKTVADFDLEAYNKQYNNSDDDDIEIEDFDEEIEDFDEDIEDFDEEDFDEEDFDEEDFDEEDFDEEDFDEADFNEEDFDEVDFDEIEDDIFEEDSIIQNFDLKKSSRKRKSRKKNKSTSNEKTVTVSVDENLFDDDDDDIQEQDADKTEIFQLSDFEDSPQSSIIVELARLKIIEGTDQEDFSIQDELVTVGRGSDADIVIKSNTLSRVHFEISKGKRGFTIKDLGSSNGISINGKTTKERKLRSGDIIAAGKVKFEFVDMQVNKGGADISTGSVILRRPGMPKKKKIIIISAAAGAFLLLIIVGALFMKAQKTKKLKNLISLGYVAVSNKNWNEAERFVREAEALKPNFLETITLKNKIKSDRIRFRVEKFFAKGVEAYKNKEWKASLEHFNEVLKFKPDYKSALVYKKQVEFEMKNKEFINNAKKDAIKEDYKSSILKLRQIKDSSAYYSEAQELMTSMDKKHLAYRFKLAKDTADKAKEVEEFERALSYLDTIMEEKPDYEGAQELKKIIDDKIMALEKTDVPVKPTKGKVVKRPRVKRRNKYHKALTYYSAKKFDKAIKALQKLKSAKKVNDYIKYIKYVQKYITMGDKYFSRKKVTNAIRAFNKALSGDAKVNKSLAPYIKGELGKLYVMLSKTYLIKRNYTKAYKALVRAKHNKVSNKEYNRILSNLRSRAKDIFLRAYQRMAVNPDSAKRDFKIVLGMLPSSEQTYQKAKAKLNSLK